MTQKEFDILNAINLEGWDSNMWGLHQETISSTTYGPFEEESLPPHIYVYAFLNQKFSNSYAKILNSFDKVYYLGNGHFVFLYWLNGMIN